MVTCHFYLTKQSIQIPAQESTVEKYNKNLQFKNLRFKIGIAKYLEDFHFLQ